MTAKLVLSDLSKRYGETVAVEHLDLSLEHGEFISLLGASGCGKTTTLRMIAGFVAPSGGTIQLNGRALSSQGGMVPPEKRAMSMIFQSYALWPNMSVEQNVAFGLRMRKVPKDEMRRRVGEILEVVRLDGLARRYPNELSGGQQQRVSLARALVVKPEILLLDEPLSNLDANLREEMRGEIRRLHNEFGMTSIYVTHDQTEAMTMSSRIAVMNRGRIEQLADPLSLYAKPATRYVAEFVGRSNVLRGERRGDAIDFGAFMVPAAALQTGTPVAKVECSLRPQAIALRVQRPAGAGAVSFAGKVAARSFLGDTWEYVIQSDEGGLRVRAMSSAPQLLAAGDPVWLEIDPRNLVPLGV
jgi:ABC-type Fe3+/spermidine/putrescine transport system ATPase subunit